MRVVWSLMAVLALVYAVTSTREPMSTVSLGCSKTGRLDFDGAPEADCDTPIVEVLGVWPFVVLALLLCAPALVAALVMRRWSSWLAVAAYGGLSFAGVANWAGFWILLLVAVPMALVAVVLATVHQFLPLSGSRDVLRR